MSTEQITVGSTFPTGVTAKLGGPMDNFDVSGALATGLHVLCFIPGAATPTCSSQIPAYLQETEKFKSHNVDAIYVVTVNDAFVVGAWATKLQEKTPASATGTPVKFLADDTGKLAASLGLLFDATPILGGHRAKRAAIIVKDGKVISVEVETDPSQITVSSAESVLAKL